MNDSAAEIRPRADSVGALSRQSMSALFLSDDEWKDLMDWTLRFLSTKRFKKKAGEHDEHEIEHEWIFQYIDIIYVGTMSKLSHMIGNCGRGIDVYVLAFSYFAIMFSSRHAFDVYTCISGASGILHIIAFCFFGMGVFIMTINISSSHAAHGTDEGSHGTDEGGGGHRRFLLSEGPTEYGSCERSTDYDTAFALAFIFTRMVLVTMYGLYFFVFHESNIIGSAPDLRTLKTNLDIARESDLELAAMQDAEQLAAHGGLRRTVSTNADPLAHTGLRRTVSAAGEPGINIGLRRTVSTTSEAHYSHGHGHGSHTSHDSIENPLARLTMHRTSFVVKAANDFRPSVVRRHFLRIFLLKVAPVVLSSLIMCAMLVGVSPVVVLPIVAFVEFVGDFLPSHVVADPEDWKELNPHRHFALERLGLFFMLVMGEAILGFCLVAYTSSNMSKIYRVVMFSFITIFTLGLQRFEPLQTYIHPEGPHPLDVQKLSPIYVWLNCLNAFFMLVASNGMVLLYEQIADKAEHYQTRDEVKYDQQRIANGIGAVVVLNVLLNILDKSYYRERYLPAPIFKRLNAFYVDAEDNAHGTHSASPAEPTTTIDVSKLTPQEQKDHMAIGVRKIRPLTHLKLLSAVGIFTLWGMEIATEDYMMYNAGLVVFPSLVEIILEIRNFVKKHRRQRTTSKASAGVALQFMNGTGGSHSNVDQDA